MIRAGFGQLQDLPPDDLRRLVGQAEHLGYDTFWYANEKFLRDPYIGLALAAVSTERIRLGTYIADPYSVHPVLTAVSIATLDELSEGRAVLLLGAGGTGLKRLGIDRQRPATAIGEAITVIRALLAGETVTYHGESVQVEAASLAFPARRDLPIYVASRGDQVLRVAGEQADGVMIATYATPRGVRHAIDRIEAGATRAGRSLADLALISRVDGWVDEDPKRARDGLRSAVARMLAASHPDRSWVDAAGVEIPPALAAIVARRDREAAIAAAHLVPDELVDAFTWTGTAEEVAAKVAAIVDLGVSHITFMPHPPPGESAETAIRAFATEVLPRVAAHGVTVAGLDHP